MARYSGKLYKGASKDLKAEKRAEAEARAKAYASRYNPEVQLLEAIFAAS